MDNVLKRAMTWALHNHPGGSSEHKAAFANAVAYLVTGDSGGYGGPSLREHLVCWSLGAVDTVAVGGQAMTTVAPGDLPLPGRWDFDAAVAYAANLCFSPAEEHLKTLLQIQEREHCFDDDPADLAALRGKN